MFGLRETRYRGLAKVPDQAFAAVAAAGRMIAGRGRRLCGPPLALSAKRRAPRRGRLEERRRRAEGGAPVAAWSTAGRPTMVWEAAAWPPETGVARLGALELSLSQKSPMLVPKGRDRRLYHRLDYYRELIVSYRKIVGDLDMREVEDCMALYRRADSLFGMMQGEVL